MPTRQAESTHEAEPEHPIQERQAGAPDARTVRVGVEPVGVESPGAEQLQGASSLPRETNSEDDITDQDIDTAGTEADEHSIRHSSLGLPKSDGGSPTKSL